MQNKPRLTSLSLAVVATTLLLGSSGAFAANYKGDYKGEVVMPVCNQLRDGFYVGAQGGYDSYRVRETTGVGSVIATNPAIANNGWFGGLFGGYGMYWNNMYYLAGEIFGNYNGSSQGFTASTATQTFSTDFRVRSNYGISALPGIKLNDGTLLYVRLGYNRADFRGSDSFGLVGAVPTTSANTSWEGGFQYGLGLETVVWQNLSFRTEYAHTSFSSFTTPSGTTFSPSDNAFSFGLVYHIV